MSRELFPFWSAILAAALAQLLKPITYYAVHKEWSWSHCKDSGGMPSSHTAMVTALAVSVGLQEGFSSLLFAVTFTFSCIVIYDAANVRYYSGQNARVTQQLVKDVQKLSNNQLINPIYNIKLKDVLGHRWVEVFCGMILGAAIALIFHFCI
ncbi:MAG: divergent PAP2 family protein [Galactobacillus timonensis]|jgi:acid phosphatase family membrane protein YuiD|uniref:divergent PAP2 family protein n=1 Tax=Galactobacillus timonensis TaxID=2041840 RepID=UPI000C83351C|nr:divergent PAP2 family protein [Galactobacillus timonensis]MDY5222971.1 divergent PAP2 family protein [Lachnospiraceae bacterium]MDY6282746.1 divergent PAP2 family protein [Erysipelotrichaceae bacterium]MCI6067831.1 divergent PAP2 family protein [Galactobacillus timonensis]MCI6754689.1 divergent PAP2 family protein [Galactobacillus timonensis]MDD5850615.1 divergent PAP2 family protein [Galactobacillus timonensis]